MSNFFFIYINPPRVMEIIFPISHPKIKVQMVGGHALKWRDVVNKHGGDVRVVHLPEIGIKGNTHFPFSDLNNIEIADLLSLWMKEKKLD